MKCSIHSDTDVLLICGICNNTPVCTDCITGEHIGHKFVKPEDLIQTSNNLLETRVCENKQLISELESDLDQIKSEKAEQKSHSNDVEGHIDTQTALLHGVIDCIAHDLKKQNQLELEKNLETLEEQEKDVDGHLNIRKIYDREVTKILESKNSFHIIKAVKDFCQPTTSKIQQVFPNTIEFSKGDVDLLGLQVMVGGVINKPADAESGCDFVDTVIGQDIGKDGQSGDRNHSNRGNTVADDTEVSSDSLKIVSSFKCLSSRVSTVIPSLFGKSWIKSIDQNKITLVDCEGKQAATVDLESFVCGVTASNDPNILYASGMSLQKIQKISVDKGKVKNIFSTAPLFPYGISHTASGTLLVILNHCLSFSPKLSSTIIRYSLEGKVLDRCQNRAFGSLARIRINKSEKTIIITNKTSDDFNYLMLLTPNFEIRMSYFGDGNTLSGEYDLQPERRYKPFRITDVCVDIQDNIYLCELRSKTVEILSPTCERLSIFQVDDTEIPRSVGLNGDNVWIGCVSGKVFIYKTFLFHE